MGESEIVVPQVFALAVLGQESPGGAARRVDVVLPSVTVPGEPFEVRVAVLDGFGYPSVEYEGLLRIQAPGADPSVLALPFARGVPAVGAVRGVVLREAGFHRFRAELNGQVFHSNPTRCARQSGRRIYWGDPHVHTVLSNCHANQCRSLNYCFAAGRYVTGLDWVSAADHVSNGRCDLSKWKEQVAGANAWNDPPAFATLPAYEASLPGGCGGDTNVYMARFPDLYVDAFEDGNARTLCETLAQEKLPEGEFFVVPHHTTRPGKHGEIPDDVYPGPDRMPVIEIHSKWGTSEYRGNPTALQDIHPGPSYAVDLLNRGLALGFVGGTDTHATIPSGGGEDVTARQLYAPPGFTAVWAETLSRESVFRGIQRRACYATCGDRMYVEGAVGGEPFGRIVSGADAAAPRAVEVAAAASGDIARMEVVRNGETVYAAEPGTWHAALSWTDETPLDRVALPSKHLGRFVYYYVRVTGPGNTRAWSSPVWFVLG